MEQLSKGLFAALMATLTLSVLMVFKAMLGIIPALDLPSMIAGMMGAPDEPLVGWAIHFVIGVVLYGVAIATVGTRLPDGDPLVHGLLLGMIGWFIMMVLLMQMVGAGLFGMSLGLMAPIMTLILHLVFGAVLGLVYGRATERIEVGDSTLIGHGE